MLLGTPKTSVAGIGEIGWVILVSAALVADFAPLAMHLYRHKG